jgi:hypothetical protein
MKRLIAVAIYAALGFCSNQVLAQAIQLPPAEQCFQATTGINGMVGTLGAITGGSGGTAGTYTAALTGGAGTGATATITVSGGAVTAIAIQNPGLNYVVGNALSASSGSIGGVTGFSVPVASISINSSLAGGTVGMYVPGTLTPKQTWQDFGETSLNTNPIQLDQNGCALIYGEGEYRQILTDSLGNIVWDQVTNGGNNQVSIFTAGNYTVTATDRIVVCNKSIAGATTVTLPAVALRAGQSLQYFDWSGKCGDTTFVPNGSETIEAEASWILGSGGVTGSGGAMLLVPSSSLSGWLAQ